MAEKKDPGRFTISLNLEDMGHRKVAEALNRQGPRRKAQFIVNAVLHYMHCTQTPVIPAPQQTLSADPAAIESIIIQVLAARGLLPENDEHENISAPLPIQEETVFAAEVRRTAEAVIDQKEFAAMHNSMAAFRQR